MALFSRKKNQDQLVQQIVDELAKAGGMANTPMANYAQYATSSANMPAQMSGNGGQGLLQTPGTQANPLPRPANSFGSQLGPSAPFLPAPLDPVDPSTGRALPRIWEYPVAWNLDLNQRTAPWSILRALVDQCDVIHRCIEIRVAELVKQEWSFTLTNYAITQIMEEENCSHAKAQRIGRERYASELNRLREFWENPYPELGRGWNEWLSEFLWQHFAFDGVPVYPRYSLGRKILGFEIIDAPTIKVLLDNRGAVPTPPAPAYQQVLWGFPRGEYQTTPEADGEFYSGDGGGAFLKDQLSYFVRNRRTWSPYGFSSVEEAVPLATLYLERQRWLKSEYVDGTMPMTFMETDMNSDMDPLKLSAFERVFNDSLMGSTAERHRIKVLPGGFRPVPMPTVDERYNPDYDELLIKRIGAVFGVSSGQLGIVPRSGLGGKGEADGQMDQAETMSQRPMEEFIVEMVNTLSRRFLNADKNVTFVLTDATSSRNEETMAKAYDILTKGGLKTINDIRGEMGEPLYDLTEADEPFVMTSNGPVFLKGLLAVSESGETIEQKDENDNSTVGQAQETVQENVPQAEGQAGPVSEDQGSTPGVSDQDKAIGLELQAFEKFVRSRAKTGNWRDFNFEAVEPVIAKDLNAQAGHMVREGIPMDLHFIPKAEKTGEPARPFHYWGL
jgi:hypothetical protein